MIVICICYRKCKSAKKNNAYIKTGRLMYSIAVSIKRNAVYDNHDKPYRKI